MTKNIAILGSTGSIGTNALRVIDALGPQYRVAALTAHSNAELLTEQVRRYRPRIAAMTNGECPEQLLSVARELGVEVLSGPDSLVQVAELEDVDVVLTAVVGAAGLPSVLAAAKKGKTLAIANKEPLVIAGELLTAAVKDSGGQILPIDSEHSAIFQAMQAGRRDEVARIVLTSSGGPFRQAGSDQIENVSVEEALAHPTWDMGPKITIDSATMMNKALEVIEARWLFEMPVDKIEVLIHPESIVHSMVEFVDGSIIAQLGHPDMCLPIQYALTYPDRVAGVAERLELDQIGTLSFEKPDMERFRALALGYEVISAGGTAPVVFNAANEAAVGEFLAGKIKFVTIVELIERCLDRHNISSVTCLDELLEVDAWARSQVAQLACAV